jgi:hypothetical protein
MAGDGQEQGGEGRGSGRGGGKAGSGENVGGMRDARRIRAGKSDLRSAGFRMASTRQPLIGILITTLAVARIWAIDPASEGGENVAWTMRPNPEDESQLHGWRDLQGFRILKPDDSHYGDRSGSFSLFQAEPVHPSLHLKPTLELKNAQTHTPT